MPLITNRMLRWKDTLFVNVQELGSGGSGRVLIAENSQTKEQVAIKIMKHKQISFFRREVESLRAVKGHPNIIEFHKAGMGKEHALIFMEPGGSDLSMYLQERGALQEEEARELFSQMLEALIFCHVNRQICHHDVKLENFLIDPNTKRVKLIDFGFSLNLKMARLTEDGKISNNYIFCSPAYASKQVLFKEAHHPEKTDVFGLGVCLYMMVCGVFPWCDPQDDLPTLKKNMLQCPLSFPPEISLSSPLTQILEGMLQLDEESRWALEEVRTNAWFNLS